MKGKIVRTTYDRKTGNVIEEYIVEERGEVNINLSLLLDGWVKELMLTFNNSDEKILCKSI